MASAQTWQMAPTQKTATETSRLILLPSESPAGAASSAPTAVPALRMATMRDASLGHIDRFNDAAAAAAEGEVSLVLGERQLPPNRCLNSVMARMPLMALHAKNGKD